MKIKANLFVLARVVCCIFDSVWRVAAGGQSGDALSMDPHCSTNRCSCR
jgi:hypothetical protein